MSATDLLIDACARYHEAALEQADSDFDRIEQAVPRRVASRPGGADKAP